MFIATENIKTILFGVPGHVARFSVSARKTVLSLFTVFAVFTVLTILTIFTVFAIQYDADGIAVTDDFDTTIVFERFCGAGNRRGCFLNLISCSVRCVFKTATKYAQTE